MSVSNITSVEGRNIFNGSFPVEAPKNSCGGVKNVSQISEENPVVIDIVECVKKVFASLAVSLLSIPLIYVEAVMLLTGFAIIPTAILGHLAKPVHLLNVSLAKHSFKPFRFIAEELNDEHTLIVQTYKVIDISKGKLQFYPQKYKKQMLGSLRYAGSIVICPLLLVSTAIVALASSLKLFERWDQ